MRQIIDNKFEKMFWRGAPVPLDEPLFLLRGRDQNAIAALSRYYIACARDHCCDEIICEQCAESGLHLAGIAKVIAAFVLFSQEHPERMKQPGSSLRKGPQ